MYTRRFEDRSIPPSGYSGSFMREPEPEIRVVEPKPIEECAQPSEPMKPPCDAPKKGLLSGLFSNFSLELDDLILIGLLLLLLGEREDGDSDELLIILAILLLTGFNT